MDYATIQDKQYLVHFKVTTELENNITKLWQPDISNNGNISKEL